MSRLDIVAGDDWFIGEDQAFRYTIVDDNRTHAPVDLTGYNIVFELALTRSGDPLFVIPVTIVDPLLGVVEWTVPSDDTINLTGDLTYWYTLRLLDIGGKSELAWGSAALLDVYVNY